MLVVGWIDCLCFGKGCISMAYLMTVGGEVGFEGTFDDG